MMHGKQNVKFLKR